VYILGSWHTRRAPAQQSHSLHCLLVSGLLAMVVVAGEEPCQGLRSNHGMAADLQIAMVVGQAEGRMCLCRASLSVTEAALGEAQTLLFPFPSPGRAETVVGRMVERIARLSMIVHYLHGQTNGVFPVLQTSRRETSYVGLIAW
jgi:hypothetical protein